MGFKRFIGPAVIAVALAGGAAAAVALTGSSGSAQVNTSSSPAEGAPVAAPSNVSDAVSTLAAPAVSPEADAPRDRGPHTVGSCTEQVLTGDNAAKATAVAKKAVPNATVERVETDCDGAAFEAHMKKSDGSCVTVKMDKDFNVTGTETGRPGGPHGPGGRHHDRDGNDQPQASPSSSA